MVNIIVYGSLRKGLGNHLYLTNSDYIGTATLKGYKMYSLGWYPAIVPTRYADEIEVECYTLSLHTFRQIHAMETGAGYKIKEERVILENGEPFDGYVYYFKIKPNNHVVKGGKWKKL